MAAIFGAIATSPGVDLPVIADRMQARLAYRAPDGFGRWSAPDCVLGHGALRLDKNAEAVIQPLRLADGRLCVADGYVANFEDLRVVLGVPAAITLDDAQLLALAIERWDLAFTDHLHGEFVVALWDPEARRLHLVRDHLGGRPVCYVQTRDMFAFASSSLALAGLAGVPAQLDPLGIAAMWYDDAVYLDDTRTAFNGIQALAPAHGLDWEPGASARIRRYWRLQPREAPTRRDPLEHVEAFRHVFGDSVARAMRGSPKTSLMLSGGIDSGAILAARRGFRAAPRASDLLCVSAVLGPGIADPGAVAESENILAMTLGEPACVQFEVPVTGGRGGPVCPADVAEEAWSWLHPADLSLLVPSLACRLARERGARLVMNGVDGDNMTSPGLYYLDALVGQGQLALAWRESRRAPRVNTYLLGQTRARLLARALVLALEPDAVRRVRQRRNTESRIRGLERHPFMAPGLAARAGLPARLRLASERRMDQGGQQRADHLAWWLGYSMSGSESVVSRHGLEVRHPWCDLRVLDYFQQLPFDCMTREGWTKWVVRKACEEALGRDVAWHSGKRHLGYWLHRQALADAAPWLRGLLDLERPSLGEYVRDEVVELCLRDLSVPGLAAGADCDRLLSIVALAGWLRYVRTNMPTGGY